MSSSLLLSPACESGHRKSKKDGFKVHQKISCHLRERQSLQENLQQINCKLAFSWSRPHYSFHSIFSFFCYFQMMRSDFIAYSTYTIKWEVNQGQVVCQKTSKTQTLHVTVYFHAPLDEISRSATPNLNFRVPWIRLMLKLPCLHLFKWFVQSICSPNYTYQWELKQKSRFRVLCCFSIWRKETIILCISGHYNWNTNFILHLHKEKLLFYRATMKMLLPWNQW